jgi:hypothetical protein
LLAGPAGVPGCSAGSRLTVKVAGNTSKAAGVIAAATRDPAAMPAANHTRQGVTLPCTKPFSAPLMPSTRPVSANLPTAQTPFGARGGGGKEGGARVAHETERCARSNGGTARCSSQTQPARDAAAHQCETAHQRCGGRELQLHGACCSCGGVWGVRECVQGCVLCCTRRGSRLQTPPVTALHTVRRGLCH